MKSLIIGLAALFISHGASAQHEFVGMTETQINATGLKLEKKNDAQLGDFLYFESTAEKASFILDTAGVCKMVVVIPVDNTAMYNRLKGFNTSPNLIKAGTGVWKYIKQSSIITISYMEQGETKYFTCRETLD